jgi:phosphohistidine phosphatase
VACLNLAAHVDYLEPLYSGDVDDLLDAVRELATREDPPATVLLVGHNPSVHQLVLELTGGEQLPGFPPSALAVLTLDVADWYAADTGAAQLTAVHLPGDHQD